MSFSNVFSEDLEAASVVSAHYKDFPEFDSISKSIDSTLQDINLNQLVSIRNLVREYENLRESGEAQGENVGVISRKYVGLTGKCTEAFKSINQLTQRLNSYLNECEANHEDEDTLRYLRQKEALSLNLVKNSLRQFQSCQRKFKAFETEVVETGHAAVAATDSSLAGQIQHGTDQNQVQITYEPINAEELEQQSLMVEEREREIQQISQDTREINEIFLNLQDIVQEQQFQVDTIEDNILSYSADARGASRELRRAERYQRRSGGRMLCCLLILIGVFGSVILIGLIF
ncbi:t-SNARE [Metschnikowia bicuspidata var. bicuspidata NRRL YB-4993]|uniref:t-SNARE n=1 Tax=Metschnikowia bicuspidata var. bicuspidata NRRL YB-4993 TaxID=869754 RepID=A0A1A0HK09_9ASCO|nr:t-SNARE [Metschnikowia bicuspidata var. bicuspidata NRRL YB-4993]OBA24514.1 t-SNARE [Metschnikowia bicuspidata var. bicuspidata NRRL YB-4993]